MSRNRARRLSRLLAAQEAIAQAASARRHAARAAEVHSEAAGEAMLQALGEDSPLHGLMTGLIAGALTRNAVETHRLAAQSSAAAREEALENARAKALATRAAAAAKAERRTRERRALEELVSRPASRP